MHFDTIYQRFGFLKSPCSTGELKGEFGISKIESFLEFTLLSQQDLAMFAEIF